MQPSKTEFGLRKSVKRLCGIVPVLGSVLFHIPREGLALKRQVCCAVSLPVWSDWSF